MKRIFSALLTLALALSLSASIFAAEMEKESTNTQTADKDSEYKASIDVSGTYLSKKASDEIISVVVAWEDMNFTYYGSRQGTWNPTSHTYDGEKTAAWNKTKANITVTNHSNLDVVANLSYTASVDSVTGSLDYQTLNLESAAEGDSLGNVEKAPFATSMFTIGGSMDNTSKEDLGTITISLNSKWTTVSSFIELQDALKKGGDIKLAEDISCGEILTASANFNLDMNGKTLTIKQLKIEGASIASIYNGKITSTGTDAVTATCQKLTIDNCTLTGNNNYALFLLKGEAVVRNTTLVNGVDVEGGTLIATENVAVDRRSTGIVVAGKNSKAILCFDPQYVVPTHYITNGYITNNGDGTWTIKTS